MYEHYPKRRHTPVEKPAEPEPPPELTEAEIEYTAQQRALFLELFGEVGNNFVKGLYAEGLLSGWRCIHNVHLKHPNVPDEADPELPE